MDLSIKSRKKCDQEEPKQQEAEVEHTTSEEEDVAFEKVDRLCQVCLEPACKHNHYGAQVCSSCRGFFRRVVMNNRNDGRMNCSQGDSKCNIDSTTRKDCSKCRYDKCLKVGMRPKWIMTADERKARRKQRLCKVMKQGPNNLVNELNCDLTKEEDFVIDKILNDSYDAFFNTICDILIVDASPVLTIHDAILLGEPITVPFLKLVENNTRAVFRRILHKIVSHEEGVHPGDHEAIVACNFGPFFSCLMGVYVNPMDITKMLEDALAYMRRRKSEDDVFQMIEELFNQIVAEGKISGMIYDRVFSSPWAPSYKNELRHRHCLRRLNQWTRLGPDEPYDDKMSVLALVMVGFAPPIFADVGHAVTLKDREALERVQHKYAFLLYKYLRSVLGPAEGRTRFATGINLINLAREAYTMHSNMLPL